MLLNKFKLLLFFVVLVTPAYARFTVHLLNPWAKDPLRANSIVYIQSGESGWYPGAPMITDFGDWVMYTFNTTTTASTDRLEFMSVIPSPNDAFAGKVVYKGGPSQILINSLFKGNESATDVWLIVEDTTKPPKVQFISPPCKVIRFFKPWTFGGADIDIAGEGILRMRSGGDYCGWLTAKYGEDSDNLKVRFRNTIDSTWYGAGGIGSNGYIDLTTILTGRDTVWVLGDSIASPALRAQFPGKLGDCGAIRLAAKLRDIDTAHPGFNKDVCHSWVGDGVWAGLVNKRLGNDGLPVLSDTVTCLKSIDWFETEDYGNGYSNEKCYNLTLHKNDEGLYEYDTSEFFPLDSFLYLDDEKTLPNPNHSGGSHNISFSMELTAEFEYVKGQEFYFRGDDDVWVYIDSQLVVDLGGIHAPAERRVDLGTLGLTPGETYSFKLFFCERNCCGSSFRMVTSINLRTSAKIFSRDTLLAPGTIQYTLFEKVTQDNMACDASESVIDTNKATVDFYIEGPPFTTAEKLAAGTWYGGVTVLGDFTGVIIDEPSITGLIPGEYQIHYYSTKDRIMEGVFKFTVYPKPKFTNTVERAAYYTDNGRGAVDRVEIYFSDTLQSVPDSLLLSWPSMVDNKMVVNGIALDPIDKKHVTVRMTEPFPENITRQNGDTRLGRCYFHDSTFVPVAQITVPFFIADSVGPLIKSAVLIERIEPGNDTLLLTFTEKLKDTSLAGNTLTLFKKGTRIDLAVISTLVRGDTTIFIVGDYKENAPGAIDSLALNALGAVSDVYGNHAHPANRPVPFTLRKVPGKVVSAYYLDFNADGLVDRATLKFNKPVALADFTVMFAWRFPKTLPLDASRFMYGVDSTEVNVNLTGAFSGQQQLTSGVMQSYVEYAANGEGYAMLVNDSAAPVLTSAAYHPGIAQSGIKPFDTLVCTFSEPVYSVEGMTPFWFSPGGSLAATTYLMQLEVLKNEGSKWFFRVKEILGVDFPATGDSVWIHTEYNVSDSLHNIQMNPGNHRVPLIISIVPITYSIKVGPNPLRLSQGDVGTVISVEPSVRQAQFVKYSVDIVLYDAVGNVVIKKHFDSWNSLSAGVSFTWNGCNTKGRMVGGGTYLAHVAVHDILRGRTEREMFKIGVVR